MDKNTYELIGVKVKEKLKQTVYAGKHAGKTKYLLVVEVDGRPEVKSVKVYPEMLGLAGQVGQEQMLKDIQESNYADKRYLFYVHRESKNYSLVGWKELSK